MPQPTTKTIWWDDPVIGSFLRDFYAQQDAIQAGVQQLSADAQQKIAEAQAGGGGGAYTPTAYDFASIITN